MTKPPVTSAIILLLAGCGGTDRSEGREHLERVLDGLPAGTEVLAYEPADDQTDSGATGWIVASPGPLPTPADAEVGPAPASAVLTAAAAMGADASRVGTPAGSPGSLYEWAATGAAVRVRSVGTDRGTLSHVEVLPP